jgi:hypothetical protein
MFKPSKPAEPSMDEILASIRKIIAEEPIGSRPVVPQAGAAADGEPAQAADEGAKGAAPMAKPVVPQSVDDDLFDIVDAVPGKSKPATKAPLPSSPPFGSLRPGVRDDAGEGGPKLPPALAPARGSSAGGNGIDLPGLGALVPGKLPGVGGKPPVRDGGVEPAERPLAPLATPAKLPPAPAAAAPAVEKRDPVKEPVAAAPLGTASARPKPAPSSDGVETANSALEALAQGLAAARIGSQPPVEKPRPDKAAAADVGRAPPVASPAALPMSTVEDTLAELLRPMLREWLDSNMPRIVEKALRVEVASSVAPTNKSPSRNQ